MHLKPFAASAAGATEPPRSIDFCDPAATGAAGGWHVPAHLSAFVSVCQSLSSPGLGLLLSGSAACGRRVPPGPAVGVAGQRRGTGTTDCMS